MVRVSCPELRNILAESKHRLGRVTLPNWRDGRPLAIDVAVTSPFSAFGMRSLHPADSYSDTYKHKKFQPRFRGKWCMFAALVMESTGGLSQEAHPVEGNFPLFRSALRCREAWARLLQAPLLKRYFAHRRVDVGSSAVFS